MINLGRRVTLRFLFGVSLASVTLTYSGCDGNGDSVETDLGEEAVRIQIGGCKAKEERGLRLASTATKTSGSGDCNEIKLFSESKIQRGRSENRPELRLPEWRNRLLVNGRNDRGRKRMARLRLRRCAGRLHDSGGRSGGTTWTDATQ